MKYRGTYIIMAIVVAAMVTVGCAGVSKPSTFYLLGSLPESGPNLQTAANMAAPSILIGPITLPAYLDRNQIVTVTADHRLQMDEFDRWAEPLKDNFYRVLAEDLSLLMGTPAVYAYDRRGNKSTDFRVVIDVTRFDYSTEGQTYLTAFWTINGSDIKEDLIRRKSVIRITVSSQEPKGRINSQNRALTQFSREIATALQSLQP